MRGKIAAWAAAISTVTGLAVGVATPAQAWSYCNPVVSAFNKANFWPGQGYCGYPITASPASIGNCITLVGGPANEWMAAVYNRTRYDMTIYQADNCSTSYNYKLILTGTSFPDLYPYGLYKNVSSIRFWPL